MKKFFEPNSVAVIGASDNPAKLGHSVVRNLRDFKGEVYPINPHCESVLGFKCYKSVLNVPEKIDLGVIIIPAKGVAKVLIECGRKKIRNVIVISAGFAEIGNLKGELGLKKIAKKYKIRILGPNGFGVVNTLIGLDTSFGAVTPDKGDIAFISQSGALWAALSIWSIDKIGFSKFASLGNMLDVDFADLVDYFNKDDDTKVIVCYVERIKEGKHFMDVCSKSKKPVIVIKAGKTSAGVKAAMSHTGSLTGSYEVYKAAFKQCGAYMVDSITEAFDKAVFLSRQEKKSNKTVIVTNGGGVGVLTADHCADAGLNVVSLPKNFVKLLKLPKNCSFANPLDIVGDANWDRYKIVFDSLVRNKSFYDNVIVVLLELPTIDVSKTVDEILNFKERSGKSVVCCFMGGVRSERAMKRLIKEGIPCFFEPERCVGVLR